MAQFIGQYEILKELGTGRFGAVVLATGDVPGRGAERPTRQIVAIKRLRDLADRDRSLAALRQRLARLDQVSDRRIARVYEVLADENAVVMEYVHGVTLAVALDALKKAREQFFTEAAVEIACEVAEALFAAWSRPATNGEPLGLLHQRIKPANIMLCPNGEVKILDFGVAQVVPSDAASGRAPAGDLIYQAPEQARGEEVDHRSDLFSLGLVLFELLLGQPAYRAPPGGDAASELSRMVRMGDLRESCRSLDQTLPGLGPILRKVLMARPEERYRGGADLVAELRRQLSKERGAYLKEFCEFYFSAIQPIEPAPVLDDGGGRTRRRSIEERLRESISRENAPPAPASPPPPAPRPLGGMPPSASTRAPSTPPPSPPVVGAGRVEARPTRAPAPPAVPQEGDPMSTPGGGKKSPPRPPIGGGASRVQGFEPSSDNAAKRSEGGPPRPPGARAPNEAGMLEMVPLSADKDKAAAAEDPSATAFFAIPAPKADRNRPSAPPPSVGGPTGVSASSGIGPPVSRPPIGVGGGMAPPPQPMIQGPVVSYGGASQSPFQVSGGQGGVAPPADAGQRVQSNRVYAILVAVFALVGVAVVAAIFLIPTLKPADPPPAPVAQPVVTTTVVKAAPVEDTGVPAPVPVAPKPKPKAPSTPRPVVSASGPAPLTVKLADPTQATSIEVTCPSNFRNRISLKSGAGTVAAVPQESCTLHFKGGPPAVFGPVHGGQSLTCSIQGTTAVCK